MSIKKILFFFILIPLFGKGQTLEDSLSNYFNNHNYDSIKSKIAQCRFLEKKEYDKTLVRSLLFLGEIYLSEENYDSSIFVYKRILILTKDNPKVNKFVFFVSNTNIGLSYQRLEEYDSSMKYYLNSQKIIETNWIDFNSYYSVIQSNISEILLEEFKFKEAKDLLSKAIIFVENIKKKGKLDTLALLHLYITISKLNKSDKDYVSSETYIKKSINLSKLIQDSSQMIRGLNSLSELFFQEEEYDSCEEVIYQTLNYLKLKSDTIGIAFCLNELSRLATAKAFYNKADSLNNLTMAIFKNSQMINDYIYSLYAGGYININLKRYDLSKRLFEEAEKEYNILYKDKNGSLKRNIIEGIATNEIFLKHYETSENRFKELFNLKWDSNEERFDAIRYYTGVLIELKRFSRVDSFLNLSINNDISKLSEFIALKTNSEKLGLMLRIKKRIDYFFLRLANHENQDSFLCATGYNAILKTKGYALNDEVEIRKDIKDESEDVKYLFRKLIKLKIDYVQLHTKQTQILDSIAILEKMISQKVKPFERFKLHKDITFFTVSNDLKTNEIAIEFFDFNDEDDSVELSGDNYFAMVLKKGWASPRFVYLFNKKKMDSLLSKDSSNSNISFLSNLYKYDGKGRQLEELIWKPLDSLLKGVKTIYLSPAGILHNINFTALPIKKDLLLGQKYQLHILGSTGDIVNRKEQYISNTSIQRAWLFGGIDYDHASNTIANSQTYNTIAYNPLPQETSRGGIGKWGFLSSTLFETASIDSLCNNNHIQSTLINGSAATETAFKNISGETAPFVLHLATHGFFFPDIKRKPVDNGFIDIGNKQSVFKIADDPLLRSGLIFSGANKAWSNPDYVSDSTDDGILTAYEVANLDLSNAKLVVMSACETGLGDIKGSEGVFGLQRAFKLAGAKNIIMSLWKVPDEQTKELMTLFYKNCFSGMSISQSLQDAQFKMSEKYPPYYWAAFKLLE